MKKFLAATAATALMAGSAFADGHASEIKIGVILGFTGPIESLTPAMADGAELAMQEVTESGKLLGGAAVSSVRADSTCIDAAKPILGLIFIGSTKIWSPRAWYRSQHQHFMLTT